MKGLFYCFLTICGLVLTLASDAVVIIGSQLRTNVETTMHDVTDPSIVDVTCNPQQMCISMDKSWLERTWLIAQITQLGLGASCSAPLVQNLTHVTLCTEYGFLLSCGTTYKVNDSHVVYSNNVTIQVNQTEVSQTDLRVEYNRWFPWRCIFPVRLLVGVHILPQISPITQFLGRQTGLGEFQAVMMLFKDPTYMLAFDRPPHLTSKDRIRVQVTLMEGPLLARLQVVHCWGTPEEEALNDEFQYPLIENYCPKESSANVTMQHNGRTTFVRWESKVFQFINFTKVYLHCNVKVCFDGIMCEKTCDSAMTPSRRKRRNAYTDDAIVSVGPISPANDALVIQASEIEIDYAMNSFSNDPGAEQDFSQKAETVLGLPREMLYTAAILSVLLCLGFLVGAVFCVRRKKRNCKRSEILKHLALPHQIDNDVTFSMDITSSTKIPLP